MEDLVNNLENTYGPILVLIGMGIIFIMYWLPSIIALFRGHQNKLPIILINFFFGWTFLGWIGTLIWSLVSPSKTVVLVDQNTTTAKSRSVD